MKLESIETFVTVPPTGIGGTFWVEPRGDKKIERICECEVQVKIFGVGGVVESFIEKTTRESYEKTAAFTNRWLAEKGYS